MTAAALAALLLLGSTFREQIGSLASSTVAPQAGRRLVFGFTPDLSSQCGGGALAGARGESIAFARSSSATCTRSDGTMSTLTAGQPRLEALGLRMEPASTNLALYSEAFDSAAWYKFGPTAAANAAVAPDGTTTAEELAYPAITAPNTSADLRPNPNITFGAGTYTASVYLRRASGTSTLYLFSEAGGASAGNTACSVSTTWSRCVRTFTAAAGGGVVGLGVNLWLVNQSGQPAQTVYAWGFQVEAGSVASSYVATAGTAVTRTGESATIATSALWPVASGELRVTFAPLWSDPSAADTLLDVRTSGTGLGWAQFLELSGGLRRVVLQTVGATNAYPKSSALTWMPGTAYALHTTWVGGTVSFSRDGVAAGQAVGSVPTGLASTAYLGSDQAWLGGGGQPRGWIRELRVFR